jgi:hypothetical protein
MSEPGLDRLKRLAAYCRRCRHVVGEYVGESRILVGGILKDRAVVGKCEICNSRCVVMPICDMRPADRQALTGASALTNTPNSTNPP